MGNGLILKKSIFLSSTYILSRFEGYNSLAYEKREILPTLILCALGFDDAGSREFYVARSGISQILRSVCLTKISQIIKSDVSILPVDHLSHLLLYDSKSFNKISNDLIYPCNYAHAIPFQIISTMGYFDHGLFRP